MRNADCGMRNKAFTMVFLKNGVFLASELTLGVAFQLRIAHC